MIIFQTDSQPMCAYLLAGRVYLAIDIPRQHLNTRPPFKRQLSNMFTLKLNMARVFSSIIDFLVGPFGFGERHAGFPLSACCPSQAWRRSRASPVDIKLPVLISPNRQTTAFVVLGRAVTDSTSS